MDCFKPVQAWSPFDGGQFRFRRLKPSDSLVWLPCGKCLACHLTRAASWGLRAMCEQRYHERSCFLTLTYSNDFFPSDFTQFRRDGTLFIKRARERLGVALRFFGVPELGERSYRPHFHHCVFGADFSEDRKPVGRSDGGVLYSSPTLDALWPYGFARIGELTEASAMYVGRYCVKKEGQPDSVELVHPGTGEVRSWPTRYRPFYPVNPSLGGEFVSQFADDVFYGLRARGGARLATPRAFLRIMKKLDPQRYEVLMEQRKCDAKQREATKRFERRPERQEARETVLRAKLGVALERM